jgi:hypothetical protein
MSIKIRQDTIKVDILINASEKNSAFITLRNRILGARDLKVIDKNAVIMTNTFEDLLQECKWNPVVDDNGNIVNLEFNGSSIGDEPFLFSVIAEFVKNGNYKIEYIVKSDNQDCKHIFLFKDRALEYFIEPMDN